MHEEVAFTGPGIWITLAVVSLSAIVALVVLIDSFRTKRREDTRKTTLWIVRLITLFYLVPFLLAAYIRVTGNLQELVGNTVLVLIVAWFALVGGAVAYLLTFVYDRREE